MLSMHKHQFWPQHIDVKSVKGATRLPCDLFTQDNFLRCLLQVMPSAALPSVPATEASAPSQAGSQPAYESRAAKNPLAAILQPR
jgi:hypothetical protein